MKTVVINSSGGGSDKGISGNGIVEKDITLKISNEINNILKSNGIKTYMTRTKDEYISYDDRIKKIVNYPKNDTLVISNVLTSGNTGIEIIFPLSKSPDLSLKLNNNLSKFNSTEYYQIRYPSDPTKDYYYLQRKLPGYNTIIIKYGNPTNKKDADIIKNNYKEMARVVANTIMEYLGVKPNNNDNIYIIKQGDTLYSIAKKYNTTVDKLKDLNNLKSNLIIVGNTLIIK